jgi:cytochrome c553
MVGTISYFHNTLAYKNVSAPHSCYGECYEEYVKIHGTPAEIEQRKKAAAEGDPFASIRSLWAGCAACHGQNGEGMAVFPALAGQSSDYIVGRLNAYRNKEEIGGMSSTMWSQAAMLSDDEINLIGKFVQTELK